MAHASTMPTCPHCGQTWPTERELDEHLIADEHDHDPIFAYTYHVAWSTEDDAFVATCAEFPSMSWLAPTKAEAEQGLRRVLRAVLADMATSGEQPPTPGAAAAEVAPR